LVLFYLLLFFSSVYFLSSSLLIRVASPRQMSHDNLKTLKRASLYERLYFPKHAYHLIPSQAPNPWDLNLRTKRKGSAFWDITPCGLVETAGRFRGVYCLHYQGTRCRENLKSQKGAPFPENSEQTEGQVWFSPPHIAPAGDRMVLSPLKSQPLRRSDSIWTIDLFVFRGCSEQPAVVASCKVHLQVAAVPHRRWLHTTSVWPGQGWEPAAL
jgi:hypothetical protein